MVAMSSPWKDPRTGIYHIRRGVPKDLRTELGWEYKRSLKTRDPNEAKDRFPIALAKSNKFFVEARRREAQPELQELSRSELEQFTEVWVAFLLEEDEEERLYGVDDRGLRKRQETIDILDAGLRDALPRGDFSAVEFEVEDFIDSYDLPIPKDSHAFKQMCMAYAKASIRANELSATRQQGEIVDTPAAPEVVAILGQTLSSAGDGGEMLLALYEAWKTERRPSKKLASESHKAVRRFVQLHGDLAVGDITRRHVATFNDALLKLPARPAKALRDLPLPELIKLTEGDESIARLSAGSAKKDLGVIQSLMAWAVENGHRDDNPAAGIKIREAKNAGPSRLPYDADDLQRIFACSIYKNGERPRGGAGKAAYWLPLLGLFTGARLEELGQLLASDVREEGQVWFLDINTRDEGKRLKTASSVRKVPVHPELIRMGFIDYANGRRGDGVSAHLFPDLNADRNDVLTGNWSKWWGRYQREVVGITDRRKVFHSFRHSFKDACRAAGLEEAIHDALTGHSGGGVGRSYGQGYPLAILANSVRRISFSDPTTGISRSI